MFIPKNEIPNNAKMVIELLSIYIKIKRSPNSRFFLIGDGCPFCEVKSRKGKVFRYNSILKVGKFYCSGESFKDISWLRKKLMNKEKYSIVSESSIEKSKMEDDLDFEFPF